MKPALAAIAFSFAKADWNGTIKQMAAMSDDIKTIADSRAHANVLTGAAAG